MHTFLIAAITEDGFIAQDPTAPSTQWTSKADKQFFSQRTKEAGVIVMGRKTFETIGRPLGGRKNIIISHANVLQNKPAVFESKNLVQEISNFKFQISKLPSEKVIYVTSLSPSELVSLFQKSDCKELAVCGGASVYQQFFDAGLIDTLYLTVHPVKFGKGIPLFGGAKFEFSDLEKTYQKVEEKELDDEGTKLVVFRRQ